MKYNVINIAIAVSAIALLLLLAFNVRIAATADSVVVLKTTGMTCGSCADKISVSLQRIKGVAATEVDVEGGWVVVGYDTKIVKPEALAEKVSTTGFGSSVHLVLTPEEFKRLTGREIGVKTASASGCSGCKNGGCGSNK